jgi:hypothetical protein
MGRFLRQLLKAIQTPAERRRRPQDRHPEVTALEARQLLTLSGNIVVKAVPKFLTPPNGQYVPVTVAGSFNESALNATPAGFFYVTDQYGKLEPRAEVALHQSPTDPHTYTFSFTINLQAQRGSMTTNGRQYDILVGARDAAGAVGRTIAVEVPKDPVHPHPHGPKAAGHPAPHPHPHHHR